MDFHQLSATSFQKIQTFFFSRKAYLTVPNVIMSGVSIPMKYSISMLGITISSTPKCENHVKSIAESESQKLGFLFCAKNYFILHQLIMIYKEQNRPVLSCHIYIRSKKESFVSSLMFH